MAITLADARRIMEEAKANRLALDGCAGPHDFQPIPGRQLIRKHKCTKCGGSISGTDLYWYRKGLNHGRISPLNSRERRTLLRQTQSQLELPQEAEGNRE
jgi:hypothetical protein